MQKNKYAYLLIAIFILVLALRLYFSFMSPELATDDAYFTTAHVDKVLDGNIANFEDDLSYGGRTLLHSPLTYIIFAGLSGGNVHAMNFFSELALALMVFIVYLICRDITKSKWAAILGTVIANFTPIFLLQTTNNLTSYSFSIPIIFFMFYCVMRSDSRKYLITFIVLSFILPLIHSSAIFMVFALLFYFFILAGGALQAKRVEKEVMLISILAMFLMVLILFKRVLVQFGLDVIWQNIPLGMVFDTFQGLNIGTLLFGVGVIPLILGLWGLYLGFFREKNKGSYLFSAFALAILVMLVFRFIPITTGLVFLAIIFGIMSTFAIKSIILYLHKLNVGSFRTLLIFLLVVFIPVFVIVSSVVGLTTQEHVDSQTVADMEKINWMEGDLVVAGNLQEGNLITSIAKKKNVVDTNFLLAPKVEERLSDIDLLYKTGSVAFAMYVINKYGIDIIYLSDQTKEYYGIEDLNYAKENECFEREGRIYIYTCDKG